MMHKCYDSTGLEIKDGMTIIWETGRDNPLCTPIFEDLIDEGEKELGYEAFTGEFVPLYQRSLSNTRIIYVPPQYENEECYKGINKVKED